MWILFFVVAVFAIGCSDDGASPTGSGQGSPSGTVVEENANGDKVVKDSSGKEWVVDTVVVTEKGETVAISGKDTIYIGNNDAPYYSSGIFCWTEGCEKNFTSATSQDNKSSSSSAKASGNSSSSSAKVSSSSVKSSASQVPAVSVDSRAPTFDTQTSKLTDVRNNHTYKVEKIGSVYWMTSNLTYEPSTGFQCDATTEVTKEGPGEEKETVNVCDYYGIYYMYNAKDVVCPSGWRLPTKAEVQEALASMDKKPDKELDKWWVIGGRFKYENSEWKFGNNNGQGHLWIQKSDANEIAVRFQDYGSWEEPTFVKLDDQTELRAYNLRCVMSE